MNVARTAGAAAVLLDSVAQNMPLYTLHNERHILNVIGWMERLLGEDDCSNARRLSARCALSPPIFMIWG